MSESALSKAETEDSKKKHKIGKLLQKKIDSGGHIIAYETRIQVLHEKNKSQESESWMWAIMPGRSEAN